MHFDRRNLEVDVQRVAWPEEMRAEFSLKSALCLTGCFEKTEEILLFLQGDISGLWLVFFFLKVSALKFLHKFPHLLIFMQPVMKNWSLDLVLHWWPKQDCRALFWLYGYIPHHVLISVHKCVSLRYWRVPFCYPYPCSVYLIPRSLDLSREACTSYTFPWTTRTTGSLHVYTSHAICYV